MQTESAAALAGVLRQVKGPCSTFASARVRVSHASSSRSTPPQAGGQIPSSGDISTWRILFVKSLRNHTPPDPHRDLYLIAVLIALAQKQRRDRTIFPIDSPVHFTAHLLVTEPATKILHLYTANVASAFLDKLDFPSSPPASDKPLDIVHRCIALKPYEALVPRVAFGLAPSDGDGCSGRGRAEDDEEEG
ncbi:uncharacterized protein DNG_09375 [Cephalotrichum gorgonifer]|uniref:Uncharacterized protein n=1 Tax=Cephalotrichum gorgonifer TaxID=2041049 RepID=A0AAE8N7N2_9PEZI|nr:uncharacterized protein DNG_09375 [Cephalotrichum gorgonifer]